MKKKFLILAVVVAMLVAMLAGCNGSGGEEVGTLRVATLSGPSGMGMTYLFDNEDIAMSVFTAPDQISAKIIKGEIDIASVPANLAAVLFNKMNGGIKILSVNTYGMMYIVGPKSDNIESIADLEGRTLYATGRGATPEYVLNDIVDKAEVNIEIEYLAEHSTLASDLKDGKKTLGLLPEPFVTMALANDNLERKIDLNVEWQAIYGKDSLIPMTATIVRADLFTDYPIKISDFTKAYKDSVERVNQDPASAAELIATHNIFPQKAVAEQAIPYCNICYIDGQEARSVLENYFEMLYYANPSAVGGAIPGNTIYA